MNALRDIESTPRKEIMDLSLQAPNPLNTKTMYEAPHYARPTFVNPAEEEFGREWAFFSPDGSAYKGTWKNAMRHGFGVHVYANGDLYKGEFVRNLPDGVGQYYSRRVKLTKESKKTIEQQPELCGDVYDLVYDGQWSRGLRDGFGRFYYGPDSFYCGWWAQNLRHGRGVLFYSPETARSSLLLAEATKANPRVVLNPVGRMPEITRRRGQFGGVFMGEFRGDARHGPGALLYENGDVFYGAFKDNAADGPGVTYYVQRHSKAESIYAEGASIQSVVQTLFSQLDYEQILRAWAHVSGGFPGISLPVRAALEEKFAPVWEEAFRPYEDSYPYWDRPQGEEEERLAEQIRASNAPEEICLLLPMRMRPQQSEAQRLLHLPKQADGAVIPTSQLLDQQAALAEGLRMAQKPQLQ